jgi:hypothetical protein
MKAAFGVRFDVRERVVPLRRAVARVVVPALVLVVVPLVADRVLRAVVFDLLPVTDRVRVDAVVVPRRRAVVVPVVLLPAVVVPRLLAVVFLVPVDVRFRVDRALTVRLVRLVPFAGMISLLKKEACVLRTAAVQPRGPTRDLICFVP